MNTDFDPYKILEVEPNASADDIKKAFKQKSKTAHPDCGGTPEDFDVIKKAYEILTDPSKRKMWDDYKMADNIDVENEAKMAASQIAVQVLDTYPDNCNLDEEIAEVFKKCLRDIAEQIRGITQKKERLENRYRAVQNKPEDDFISIDIERTVNARDLQIRRHKLNMEIQKRAFELLKGYKFDINKISQL
jgi:curved DNA-binding protein CbpA